MNSKLLGRKIFIDLGFQRGDGLAEFTKGLGIDSSWLVHCFEPNSANFHHFESTPPYVECHPYAAWTENKKMQFRRGGGYPDSGIDGWGSTLMMESHAPFLDTVVVQAIDFVEWLGNNTHERDQVHIKMDIEGAEYPVIRSMLKKPELFNRIETIAVEFHDRNLDSETKESTRILAEELSKLSRFSYHH